MNRRNFIAASVAGMPGLMISDKTFAKSADKLDLEQRVGERLKARNLTVATAESCTGGLLSSRLTDVAGASAYVKGGVVAYWNEIKRNILHVKAETLEKFGAVSHQTALEMATNVREIFGATIGLSTTGFAGLSTDEGKPVGLVYVAIVGENFSEVKECHLSGSRTEIKFQAADEAFNLVMKYTT